jgi:hypothetical protein
MQLNGRKLIYVPILHTEQDMGSLSKAARDAYIAKLGEKSWNQHIKLILDMWAGIKKMILRMRLPYKDLYIYQDGLPVCNNENNIVNELASKGNTNYLIIKWLLDRGAHIIGTEDPRLLIEEYTYLKQIMSITEEKKRKTAQEEYKEKASNLLTKRDRYIKDRINMTLPKNGVGILFIGLLHKVDEYLPNDIRVNYLIYHLPFKVSVEGEVIK